MVSILTVTSFAHPGRTDSKGGHNDYIHGGYHYHHGHSAHQHPNGKCPYDYNDKTNHDSESSNNDKSESKTQVKDTKKDLSVGQVIGTILISLVFGIAISFVALCVILFTVGSFIEISDSALFIIWGVLYIASVVILLMIIIY